MKDLMAGVVLTVLSLFSVFWLIPHGIESVGEPQGAALSPSFWPYAVSILMVLFGLCLSAQATFALMLEQKANMQAATSGGVAPGSKRQAAINWPVLLAVALLIPYYYLAMHSGLLIASILAFTAYAVLAGERSWRTVGCWAVIAPTAITVFFINVAQVLIPLGPLKHIF